MRRPLAPLRTTAALALSLSLALTACGADDTESDAAKDDTSTTSNSGAVEDDTAADESAEGAEAGTAAGGDTENSGGSSSSSGSSDTKKAGDDLTPEEFANLLATSMERGRTARISTSGSGLAGATMEGEVDYTRTQPALRMRLGAGDAQAGLQTEMVMVDGAVYMLVGGTDQYLKMDASDLGEDLDRMDPGANLSNFSAGISTLKRLGEEKIDGETTHHYVAVIDATKLGDDNPAAGANVKELEYHVWLGTDDLVRKFSIDHGADGLGAMEMKFSDWGKPVDIKAPPKNKITEMPALPSSPNN